MYLPTQRPTSPEKASNSSHIPWTGTASVAETEQRAAEPSRLTLKGLDAWHSNHTSELVIYLVFGQWPPNSWLTINYRPLPIEQLLKDLDSLKDQAHICTCHQSCLWPMATKYLSTDLYLSSILVFLSPSLVIQAKICEHICTRHSIIHLSLSFISSLDTN